MHQIAPQIAAKIAGRLGPAARRAAALCAAVLLAMSLAGTVRAQDTGQTGVPQTGPSATGGTPLGQTTTAPPPPSEPGLETRQFQDWIVRCGAPVEGAPDACEMLQHRLDEQGQIVLAVLIGKVANTTDPGMLIILPLGIWLPPGIVLKVDQGEEVPARIERCDRRGCQVELLLEQKILTVLKSGTEANVLFQIYDEQGQPKTVGVPFSLLGFTAALNELLK